MSSNLLSNSMLNPAPFPNQNQEIIKESKTIFLNFKNKSYPLKISLSENDISFCINEKYELYSYSNILSFESFKNLHKYYRFFDNLGEIYNDIIKSEIKIKSEDMNKGNITLYLTVNINKDIYEIKISLNRKELDKYKDIDIIMANYIEMKKELDEIKQQFKLNDKLFNDSNLLKKNNQYINLIQEGIRHQFNRDIINTSLLYRCSRDGDDKAIFHQKCDGISNTIVIAESESNKLFGGFTTQQWDQSNKTKNDDNAFLFQLNKFEIHYIIKGKGGIYCGEGLGPTFGSYERFCLCLQDVGKSLEGSNREDSYSEKDYSFENKNKQNYILEGNCSFKLKDYEVYKLEFN